MGIAVAILFWAEFVAMPAQVGAQAVESDQASKRGDSSSAVDPQIRMMEQALEQAVGRSVRTVEQQLPTLAPGLLFFAGAIQTRGFELEGYGLFFDVEYPPLRRSILWSMGALNQFSANMAQLALANAIANLRRQMHSMEEGPERAQLSETLQELEAQVRPSPAAPVALAGSDSAPGASQDGDASPRVIEPLELVAFYDTALTQALVETMLTVGGAFSEDALGGDDWLTVAARDGRGLRTGAGARRTRQLRVRGRDLVAYREGALSTDELRQRIEVR